MDFPNPRNMKISIKKNHASKQDKYPNSCYVKRNDRIEKAKAQQETAHEHGR
jgi:hypothetical protein